ncbi:hypothetical protein KY360_04375 [Candidatus Woesearchaeota archaeon]|nr:hypothetical protein [Candidatus Woesearchaeota archaeon]
MKKDTLVYLLFIIATIAVAFILVQSNKVSGEELFGMALNKSEASYCTKIKADYEVDSEEYSAKVKIQGMAVLRDICFSELAEPVDEKITYCENVSNNMVNVCEPKGECFDMTAKEACYRDVFKDYVSYSMPPQEGEITNKDICAGLSMFRDNCLYLYAITTGDGSACELFDNRCPLRRQLCIDEAKKVNTPHLDLGDAVVYQST